MPDNRRSSSPRLQSARPAAVRAAVSPTVLQDALTPRGLFTNLFPVTFAARNLGTLRLTTKAKKEDFEDRRRPRFYQSGQVLYAYGEGLDDFKDGRFTPAIVAVGQESGFAQHLMRSGLIDYFRAKGYLVRSRRVGTSVIDHQETIASAKSGFLHILPEYTFRTYRLEGAQGNSIFAFSIEASWATVPAFEIGPRVASHSEFLRNLKLILDCGECGPHCPLHERQGHVVGIFEGFAEPGTTLTSACACEDYTPQPVRVTQRLRQIGSRGSSRNRKAPEQTLVIPGQVIKPAVGQRQVLRLFSDKSELELEGRIWLGDLTRSRKVRTAGLQVRYERIQQFLARVVGHETSGLTFPLPTGPTVILERVPVTAEEIDGY
jgi:hypothetical protein